VPVRAASQCRRRGLRADGQTKRSRQRTWAFGPNRCRVAIEVLNNVAPVATGSKTQSSSNALEMVAAERILEERPVSVDLRNSLKRALDL